MMSSLVVQLKLRRSGDRVDGKCEETKVLGQAVVEYTNDGTANLVRINSEMDRDLNSATLQGLCSCPSQNSRRVLFSLIHFPSKSRDPFLAGL